MNLDAETDGVPKTYPWVGIVLALVAAGALIFAGASKHWLGRSWPRVGVKVHFGLLDCVNCGQFANQPDQPDLRNGDLIHHYREQIAANGEPSGPWFQLGMKKTDETAASVSRLFAPMGITTLVLLFGAAFGLIAMAVLAIAKRRKDRKISPSTLTLLALFGSLVSAGLFLKNKPFGPVGVGVQYAFWVYCGALFLGLVSGQMLAKSIRPEPDPLDQSL